MKRKERRGENKAYSLGALQKFIHEEYRKKLLLVSVLNRAIKKQKTLQQAHKSITEA